MTATIVTGSQGVFWRPSAPAAPALRVAPGLRPDRRLAATLLAAITALALLFAAAPTASSLNLFGAETGVAAQTDISATVVGPETAASPVFVGGNGAWSYDGSLGCCVAPSSAVDDVGQLALPRGGANLTQERLDHIVLRHWPTSGATNAGKFGSGTSLNDLTTMIDDTVRNGAFRPNTNGRPGTIFEMDLGSTIGTNINGNATSRLRVVVSPSGDVITAFPY